MGWPPEVIIVVRHGARMDAADNQWHLTSPTPYDPPLTYGGWNQSKALGIRIASILRTRETDDELLGPDETGGDQRKRRHKVVVHSSPFLRCVQTSIAISAGLAQNPGHIAPRSKSSNSQTKMSQMHSSPRVGPTLLTDSSSLALIAEPSNIKIEISADNIKKSTLRVDAFLGEWLNPDYFEQITPPPSSNLMLAGAKADLLRMEDYRYLIGQKTVPVQGFPGGWQSPIIVSRSEDEDIPISSLSSLAQALPRRDRTSSLGNSGSYGSATRNRARSPANMTLPIYAEHGIYQPPIPAYAISSTDPIPGGYVSHARDACVDIDYQWDSMREPQCWGSGGDYGEEWSSMHKRFRKGFEEMVSWYKESEEPGNLILKTPKSAPLLVVDPDEDTDLVLVLVSHGAGCNALIGALTNQPVLLDVPMSSLTMAVRKRAPNNTPTTTPRHSPSSSRRSFLSSEYEVLLTANTEHLRSRKGTPLSSRNGSTASVPMFRERSYEGPADSNSGGFKQYRSGGPSGNFGSIRRAASVASTSPGLKKFVLSTTPSIGLWSATTKEDASEVPEEVVPDFSNESHAISPIPTGRLADDGFVAISDAVENENDKDDLPPLGLWGGPKKNLLTSQKRRWTVNERAA